MQSDEEPLPLQQRLKEEKASQLLLNGRPGKRRKIPIVYQVTTGNLSEYTKATYQYYINDFLAFYQITDKKGIEPLKAQYSPKLIRQMVMDFVIFLRDVKKVSRSSIKIHCAALLHFFYMIRDDDTKLDWTKVRMEFPPDERIRRDRAYSKEEIQKILSKGCTDTRDKVIILLLESTGMRIGGIHPLRVGHLSPKTTSQGKVYRIEVYSGTDASYYCYCNVETANVIDEYLKERSDKGEILQYDTPLVRDLKALNVKKVKPLTVYNIRYIVGKIIERSGIKDTFQFTGEAKRSKGFRKHYKTAAEMAGMKPVHVELTHGHSIGMSGHYYRPQESDVLADYMTTVADALTVSEEHKLKTKVEQLQALDAQHMQDYEYVKNKMFEFQDRMAELEDQVRKPLSPEEYRKKYFEGEHPICDYQDDDDD